MSERQEGLLLVGALLVCSFIFQMQMKMLASEIAPALAQSSQGLAARVWNAGEAAFGLRLFVIVALAGTLFCIWLLTLTRLELSLALPLASIALVVNAVGAGVMLGEAISLMRIAGILLVAAGIMMVLVS